MKTSALLTSILFGAALAQDQVPLKEKAAGWLDKAKSYIPSGTPSIHNPVEAGAAAVAAKKVQKIDIRNYKRILQPKLEGEEEWLVYVTGGNKTCFGRCGKADLAWNESVALLSALPQPAGSPELNLGRINCETDSILCNGWAVNCPSIYHFTFPLASPAGQPNAKSPLRTQSLNATTVTPNDIVRLAINAPNSRILEVPVYDGALHPVDGWMAKLGLQEYLGWFIWGMGSTPSWVIMIIISFVSRQVMSRRMINRNAPDLYGGGRAGAGAGAGAAPASAPAGSARGTPGSAGKGGKKKR